jgi:hypothetical protein
MGRKIVGIIRPFDLKQNFYVYEDGNKLATANPTIDEMNDIIFAFAQKYDVNQVDLVGPKQYNRGLSKKLQETEMTKFNENKLIINIV